MDSRRRNYSEIWSQMERHINGSSLLRNDRRLVINVVGSGSPAKLLVPGSLASRVLPHANLGFQPFYEVNGNNGPVSRHGRIGGGPAYMNT